MSETLPPDWIEVMLGELVEPRVVRVDPATLPGVPFIGLEHVEAKGMRLLGTGRSNDVKAGVFCFSAGDVLYARLRPNLVKVVCPDFDGVCSTEFIVFLRREMVSAEFLKFLLASPGFTDFAVQLSKGDRPRVSFSQLSSFVVRLPPLVEQRRIATILQSYWYQLLSAKDLLQSLPGRVAAYRQEVIGSAFRGEITADWRRDNANVESGEAWAARIIEARPIVNRRKPNAAQLPRRDETAEIRPALNEALDLAVPTWTTRCIGELFDVYVGATPSRSNAAYWGGAIPWVSSGEIKFNRISSTRETITTLGLKRSSALLHPAGTVLLAMIGEGKTRGQVAILDIDACNNQNSAAIRVGDAGFPSGYLFYFLWYNYEKTRRLAEGNSQPALNKARVMEIALPLAPQAEAELVVKRIDELLASLAGVLVKGEEAGQVIERLGSTMIEEALQGQLVIPTTNVDAALAEIADLLGADLEKRLSPKTEINSKSELRSRSPASDRRVSRRPTIAQKSEAQPLKISVALINGGGALSPEQLFAASGYSPDEIESFFLALRDAIRNGEIIEDRSGLPLIVLRSVG
ncbi:restriction endonuclease subunit S [Bradyrhizobium sp. 18BD]